jgi:hypothetical protein
VTYLNKLPYQWPGDSGLQSQNPVRKPGNKISIRTEFSQISGLKLHPLDRSVRTVFTLKLNEYTLHRTNSVFTVITNNLTLTLTFSQPRSSPPSMKFPYLLLSSHHTATGFYSFAILFQSKPWRPVHVMTSFNIILPHTTRSSKRVFP